VRQARHCTKALAAITFVAGIVAASVLAAADQLHGVTAVALAVCVVAALTGLDIAVRAIDAATRRIEELAADCVAAQRASLTDALTGLANRRHFDQRLGEAVVAALRFGEPFSVVLFDLDDFKRINDGAGHGAGDQALRHVAAVLAADTREVDVVCRWGGEEFALLLPRTAGEDAMQAAERALRALRGTVVDAGGLAARLTASAGVGAFPADGDDGLSVVAAADAALLAAKALGKDQVRRARPAVIDLTGRDRTPHASA
jgi:diguanylate cyclase (GGDEF)-like protein